MSLETSQRPFLLSFFPHSVAPIITSQPSSLNLFLTQSQFLRCGAAGYPTPQISWKKGSVEITESTANSLGVVITANRDLLIYNAQLLQSATYYCMATSSAGRVESKAAVVNVYSKSKVFTLCPILEFTDYMCPNFAIPVTPHRIHS